MGSANRIAIVFLSILLPVGLASCGGSSPSAPTPGPPAPGPLTPGAYQLTLLSSGAISGCSGGNQTAFALDYGVAVFEVQLEADGREWSGRLRRPDRGDLQLTLRMRDEDGALIGTMRGRGEHYGTPGGTQGSVDISAATTVEARVVAGPPLGTFGIIKGELVYETLATGRVTCTSASWRLERR